LYPFGGGTRLAASFYRMLFGAMALTLPFVIYQFKTRSALPFKGILFAVIAGCFFLSIWLFGTIGIMATNASVPTLIGNMAPLWVGLGSMLFFREKQQKEFWLGLLMAISGVSIMVLRDLFIPNGMMIVWLWAFFRDVLRYLPVTFATGA
jgi:drug/metabolite transporter (DMT)-like permease